MVPISLTCSCASLIHTLIPGNHCVLMSAPHSLSHVPLSLICSCASLSHILMCLSHSLTRSSGRSYPLVAAFCGLSVLCAHCSWFPYKASEIKTTFLICSVQVSTPRATLRYSSVPNSKLDCVLHAIACPHDIHSCSANLHS